MVSTPVSRIVKVGRDGPLTQIICVCALVLHHEGLLYEVHHIGEGGTVDDHVQVGVLMDCLKF